MVQVGAGRDGELVTRVLDSPAGQGEEPLNLPWNPDEWVRIRARINRPLRELEVGRFARITLREIGEALFRSLFSGQVGFLWARSIGILPDRGLRLQLRFKLDGSHPESSFLYNLPWEILCQPGTGDFLSLSRSTPVVRYLEVPRPVSPFQRPAFLRILVVAALVGFPPLDLARERREIQSAWGDRPEVEVDFLEKSWAEALREALLRRPYHILHFMGHGQLDTGTGEGVVFLQDENGTPAPLSGVTLATLLKDVPSLRLVFLNACDTARVSGKAGLNPFSGVATALVQAGLPAAVAMQWPISDPAAIAFSRAVHLRLAAGDSIDAAVTDGRQALYAVEPATIDWAIPILFTRVADGYIFGHQDRPSPADRPILAVRPWRRWLRVAAVLASFLIGALLLQAFPTIWTGLGSLPGLLGRDELPSFDTVQVGPVRVARHEITQNEFLLFVLANPQWRRDRIDSRLHDGDYLKSWISWRQFPPELDRHPVTRVSWYAAAAFCEWAGGRLPTRREWQAVAHAAEHSFPWGKKPPSGSLLNFCDRECLRSHRHLLWSDGWVETAPVGSFPEGGTREGVLDLSGNVWEWAAEATAIEKPAMGGSYLSQFDECTADPPLWEKPTLCAVDGGFRCVWDS